MFLADEVWTSDAEVNYKIIRETRKYFCSREKYNVHRLY